jgi:hypothetical protein
VLWFSFPSSPGWSGRSMDATRLLNDVDAPNKSEQVGA